MGMFTRRKRTPISESLSQTRPVRYETNPHSPFKRSSPASLTNMSFGSKGVRKRERLEAEYPSEGDNENGPEKTAAGASKKSGAKTRKTRTKVKKKGGSNGAAESVDFALLSEEFASGDDLPTEATATFGTEASERLNDCKDIVLSLILDLIDPEAASTLSREELVKEFGPITTEALKELNINLNRREQLQLESMLVDELVGHGPLEVLLRDSSISDVLVNGPNQVYIERHGRLELTDVKFRDDDHVMQIANRIVNRVGRRVDQTTPLCDARLEDGSRVNVIVPPLMLNGPTISIRKFSTMPITLDMMVEQNNMSPQMSVFLKAAAASRLNIIVSGGTGSGKTTMLNALSKMIAPGERIITIEDAAELRLQQPHVLSMETRPRNLEGDGEVTIRDLTINALRMRPDRIILGEIRGPECLDMLQAMNTGHEGSMCTLHANRPREALTRMENMAIMSGLNYPLSAIRTQIAEAIDLIIQVSRMRDGMRRIVSITEVDGMEGDIITTQELFRFKFIEEDAQGNLRGEYQYLELRPVCHEKLREYGFEKVVMRALN